MSPHDEASLVARAQRGQRDALESLWNEFTPQLFGYLVNTLKDRALAEDLLQTAWVKAIEGLPRLEGRAVRIRPWLFAVARNLCREHWRSAKRNVPLDPEEHDAATDDSGLEDKALAEQLLASLSESDRELLRLRYIADLSLADIAAALHINSVSVRVRIHRALARARKIHLSQEP
jgi:RNA polymerase sigma-70 factor (ECF subfamily)